MRRTEIASGLTRVPSRERRVQESDTPEEAVLTERGEQTSTVGLQLLTNILTSKCKVTAGNSPACEDTVLLSPTVPLQGDNAGEGQEEASSFPRSRCEQPLQGAFLRKCSWGGGNFSSLKAPPGVVSLRLSLRLTCDHS